MFWLQFLTNFLKILRAGQTPRQIAGGFTLGFIVGLSPSLTLQGMLVWLIILVLDVNLSAALLSFALFSLFAFILDPLFHALGFFFLVDLEGLKSLWTALYNAPIAPLTRFYNTVVFGSFCTALVLSLPVYFGMRSFVVAYRTHVGSKIEQWKIYQIISKNFVVRWYLKIRDLGA
ncbi:MAG: TIGR03546 family protein [Bacteroidota bacterium]